MRIPLGLELVSLDSTDMELCRRWRNDYRVWRWCRQNDVISDAEQAGWYESQSADQSIRMYKIVLKTGDRADPVGVCGLTSIDWPNRRAEFSLYIAPERQKQGLGREALRILLLHAFQNMGLGQIWGEAFDGNPALKMFEALGFKRDGVRRQFYFKDGKFHDAHLVSLLHSEWLSGQRDLSKPRGDSALDRGGDSGEPKTPGFNGPKDTLPPAAAQSRGPKTRKAKGGSDGRRISLVERAGIIAGPETGGTIDV